MDDSLGIAAIQEMPGHHQYPNANEKSCERSHAKKFSVSNRNRKSWEIKDRRAPIQVVDAYVIESRDAWLN